jgi:glycerol-3-phosphate cytidylyltransferase
MKKKILVDMSATLIHHGHIRLIKKARRYGELYIALTTDKQINKFKGYSPELSYRFRKEILEEIKGVKKVIPSNWLITQRFLNKHNVDIIISGSDYAKRKFNTKSINFKRTRLISSAILRKKVMKILNKKYGK